MKIVLAGGYDTKNLGDHGSLKVFQQELRRIDPDIEMTLLSRHPNTEFDETYHVHSIPNLDHQNKNESLGRWFNGLNEGDDTSHLRTIWKELEGADLLVMGNGRLFVDISLDFMKGPLPYYTLLVTLAKFLGIPIMIFSKTIVPNTTPMGQELLRFIVSNSDAITVRENPSRDELIKLGVRDAKIHVLPDAAFGLEYCVGGQKKGSIILGAEGIRLNEKKCIGVNFRHTHLHHTSSQDSYGMFAKLCDDLHERLGVDILMISQMTYNIDDSLDDDREVHRKVHHHCTYKNHVHVLAGEYNVVDTLCLYQCCEMVFTMRRHGLIFASTQRVPIFALAGEDNTSHAVKTLGLDQNTVLLSEIGTDKALDLMVSKFRSRGEAQARLVERVERLSIETKQYAEIALSLSHVNVSG